MLDVILSCDTEIWCDGWEALDRHFPAAFRAYVHGSTPKGDFGIAHQVRVLDDHGLKAVFFVEPLFAARFGPAPLAEIVGLVSHHWVEMHLHTEWADEARTPILPELSGKRQHLRYFSVVEQAALIKAGMSLLTASGAPTPTAFRAGSFGFNRDTLSALSTCGIAIDSSYNASTMGPSSGVAEGRLLLDAERIGDISEYPLSVVRDGFGRLRQVSLAALSYAELEQALWNALEQRYRAFVMLFHNFDLLNQRKDRPDGIVVDRFARLCAFLAANRDSFRVTHFRELPPDATEVAQRPLAVTCAATGRRIAEQLARRIAG